MKMPCIYFLFDKKEIVYIGQTMSMIPRIYGHTNKGFNSCRFIYCDNSERRRRYERMLINKIKPKYNGRKNSEPIKGRKPLYNFDKKLSKSKFLTLPFSLQARTSAHSWAHRSGNKIRTWRDGDKLIVERL